MKIKCISGNQKMIINRVGEIELNVPFEVNEEIGNQLLAKGRFVKVKEEMPSIDIKFEKIEDKGGNK